MELRRDPLGQLIFMTGTKAENDKTEKILHARYHFSLEYCRTMGWPADLSKLSLDQVLEIREQAGWQNPCV